MTIIKKIIKYGQLTNIEAIEYKNIKNHKIGTPRMNN